MKVRGSKSFLPVYYHPDKMVIATGKVNPHTQAAGWNGETKSFGQVATPQAIAELMARWVMSKKPEAVLDPAAGLGGLLHECRRFDQQVSLIGVERDQQTLNQAKNSAPSGTKLIFADYLMTKTGQFPGIIANPPYVKAHRLDYSEDVWRSFEQCFGTRLDRLTNLYALFLLKIWEDLAPQGRAAVLLPAEFLNANFGEEIKQHLIEVIRPPGIIVFEPGLNLFPDALTTSAIVFLEKKHSKTSRSLLTKADSLENAESFLSQQLLKSASNRSDKVIELANLNPREKWLNFLLHGTGTSVGAKFPRTVGDFFTCRRGIATGANDFFCLNNSALRTHGLTLVHVEPCITKATDASGLIFSSQKFTQLATSDRRCYLLNPRENGPALTAYLQKGENLQIPARHLPSHRPVWYLPENRAAADIWVAVFSRERVKYILNTSGARNLSCFHGLYAKRGCEKLAPLLTLYLNSSWGAEAFKQVNRFYGDGLNKLEPKDVEALRCPELPEPSTTNERHLRTELLRIEQLSIETRRAEIDELTREILGL
ncbi:HsdM family class I SAM-dependent methyltransferase [Pedosphaera parvula]|uniref:N-6 DNA methylase n=1 Tax=Pedosphaera parvula (strain Ellin514) TaxID=320771 RepID=B9XLR9_PEDPL|nr:N-6 DNA methylase [Pedosphaera parvula]EEF59176.1 N-6 DNA methylase [Pedosphaera parvula Ellin514]